MRNLTIKRTKSFVGSLAKMKIYIEDPASNEMLINNMPCRKIGDLKNGEQKTFSVGDQAAKVFVIADKISKNYCNEYYQLPDGQEDIFLTGKNEFNPASGNAFRFDNNTSEGIAENRKRGTRKGLVILIVAAILGAVVGYALTSGMFGNKEPKPKNFSSNGLNITLTDEFRETNVEQYTVAFDSPDVAVFALKESVRGMESYTLEQYADLLAKANNLGSVDVKTEDGLTSFEYDATNSESKARYRYFTYVYKSNDGYWMVQFATLVENADAYDEQFAEWAKSVTFGN